MGLRLLDCPRWIPLTWLAGAAPAALALWLPRGRVAAGLAAPYAVATVLLAGYAAGRLRPLSVAGLAAATALASPAVAGTALVGERAGYRLFGFPLATLTLTVAHFHYAGFTAALVAALLCAATGNSASARAAALCVPGGVVLVLIGFFVGDEVQLVGAATLTTGLWLAGWLTWREMRPRAPGPGTRLLFAIATLVPVASMLLALDWAAGETFGVPHLSLAWMAGTHGLANAVGFGLCSVLAWHRVRGRAW
jgi:hypothetical protein